MMKRAYGVSKKRRTENGNGRSGLIIYLLYTVCVCEKLFGQFLMAILYILRNRIIWQKID